jgi:hypothetical protein
MHCERVGTRRGARTLGPFREAVMVLRWFLDGTRVRQLAADNQVAVSTCYARLHEVIDLLAALAPDVHEAILAAKAARATHLNLDGTLIHTDRVAMKGPNKADLWWSGKHKHHGGNIQVLSHPDGFPAWVSDVRPDGNTTPPARRRRTGCWARSPRARAKTKCPHSRTLATSTSLRRSATRSRSPRAAS